MTLEVKLGPLSRLVFGLWLVWVVSGAGPRVLAVLHGRRQRRLAAAGCCVVCGYELVLSAPEPDHR